MITRKVSFSQLRTAVYSCFPIVPASDKDHYKKPFRQYKELSDRVSLGERSYWTATPAVFLTAISDMLGYKDEVMSFLQMGVTKYEGHKEYNRYVQDFDAITNRILMDQFNGNDLTDGEKAWLRKMKLVAIKIEQLPGSPTIFNFK